jgi:hypothetical protein
MDRRRREPMEETVECGERARVELGEELEGTERGTSRVDAAEESSGLGRIRARLSAKGSSRRNPIATDLDIAKLLICDRSVECDLGFLLSYPSNDDESSSALTSSNSLGLHHFDVRIYFKDDSTSSHRQQERSSNCFVPSQTSRFSRIVAEETFQSPPTSEPLFVVIFVFYLSATREERSW